MEMLARSYEFELGFRGWSSGSRRTAARGPALVHRPRPAYTSSSPGLGRADDEYDYLEAGLKAGGADLRKPSPRAGRDHPAAVCETTLYATPVALAASPMRIRAYCL